MTTAASNPVYCLWFGSLWDFPTVVCLCLDCLVPAPTTVEARTTVTVPAMVVPCQAIPQWLVISNEVVFLSVIIFLVVLFMCLFNNISYFNITI